MLITAAFDTGLLTLLFFIVGMIDPKWALFFLKKPDRFSILIISTVLFMVSVTLFGEGTRQAKLEKTSQPAASQSPESSAIPVPVPQPNVPASQAKPAKI